MDTRAADSDALVVEQIAQGDRTAEAELYDRFARRVYYLALRELRSGVEAEDARAETFLRVLTAIREQRVRAPGALSGFVLGTARNVIREMGRAQRRREAVSVEDLEQVEPGAVAVDVLDTGLIKAIELVIARLKPRERECLRLLYYEELTKDEVAKRLGIQRERLRLIKSRALKSFREYYAQVTKR